MEDALEQQNGGLAAEDLETIMHSFGVTTWRWEGLLPARHSAEPPGWLVNIDGETYLLHIRPEGPDGEDRGHSYRFQRFLGLAGLPVPAVRLTPEGEPLVTLGEMQFELQRWIGGEEFLSHDRRALQWVRAAGATLGRLHQASQRFPGPVHRWPLELQAGGLVQGWLDLARRKAASTDMGALAVALEHWVEQWELALPPAMVAIGAVHELPEFHIHGDYHALHLRFDDRGVCSLFGLYASRWEKRILEVATALFSFSALDWRSEGGPTRPLVTRGLEPQRARVFLSAYGALAPPVPQEAARLADALALVAPILTINGPLEDLFFEVEEQAEETLPIEDLLERLAWASSLPGWLQRSSGALAEMWEEARH
jgi:Ser/Thr protein kinase RdoA (MazF antagonist)